MRVLMSGPELLTHFSALEGRNGKEVTMRANIFREVRTSGDLATLRRIHGTIEAREIVTKEQLWDLLQAVFLDNLLDRKEFAQDLGYNISSVNRWIDARTAPHKSFWGQICNWILGAIAARVEEMEATEEGYLRARN